MLSSAERTQLYQVITIDGDTLRYKACTATGRLYDAFELTRRDGQPNQLRELPVTAARQDESRLSLP
jgi:hypothetical protein